MGGLVKVPGSMFQTLQSKRWLVLSSRPTVSLLLVSLKSSYPSPPEITRWLVFGGMCAEARRRAESRLWRLTSTVLPLCGWFPMKKRGRVNIKKESSEETKSLHENQRNYLWSQSLWGESSCQTPLAALSMSGIEHGPCVHVLSPLVPGDFSVIQLQFLSSLLGSSVWGPHLKENNSLKCADFSSNRWWLMSNSKIFLFCLYKYNLLSHLHLSERQLKCSLHRLSLRKKINSVFHVVTEKNI